MDLNQLLEKDERQCWVCFAIDEDDTSATWVRPCACKGTSKWVHQKCLLRWVDEKQKGNQLEKVACPQCSKAYIIVYPDSGPIVVVMDAFNSVVYRVSPIMAAGLVVGSIYWIAVSFGAITVMQIMGQEDGQQFLEMSDPLFLLVILPIIPTSLIVGKMIQWEDTLLSFLRRNAQIVPFLKYVMPSIMVSFPDPPAEEPYPVSPISGQISATQVLCSALVFPTVSTIIGNVFFRSVKPHLQRTACGAVAFLIFKGALKLYYKEQNYVRRRQRKILDYDPSNPANQSLSPVS